MGVLCVLVDSGDGHVVSTQLVRLLLLDDGRLWHTVLTDPIVRAGLLVDWAASGRLTETTSQLELDTTPTGNPAADALLARIAAGPNHPLTHWLDLRQPTLTTFAAHLEHTGILERKPVRLPPFAYFDPYVPTLSALRKRLRRIVVEHRDDEPAVVALAVLAQLLGVLGFEASVCSTATFDRCGQFGQLVEAISAWAKPRLVTMRLVRLSTVFGNG